MCIYLCDKITNVEVLECAGIPSIADMLIKQNQRWLGHVRRMEQRRLPRQLLYSQLIFGKGHSERNLKWREIGPIGGKKQLKTAFQGKT